MEIEFQTQGFGEAEWEETTGERGTKTAYLVLRRIGSRVGNYTVSQECNVLLISVHQLPDKRWTWMSFVEKEKGKHVKGNSYKTYETALTKAKRYFITNLEYEPYGDY